MFRRTILALSVAALTFSGVSYAQENATIVMKSGERVAGQLIDLGGVGFTIKVNGQERQLPLVDVATIDFTGGGSTLTEAEWAKLTDGRQAIVLRTGEMIAGQLYDISGTRPLKITFRTEAGQCEFASSEVSQIVLARPTRTHE